MNWQDEKNESNFLMFWISNCMHQLELIAMDKLGKIWFHITLLVNFQLCSLRNCEFLKNLSWNWLWITAFNVSAWIDNVKYQILTFENQEVADNK